MSIQHRKQPFSGTHETDIMAQCWTVGHTEATNH